MSAVTSIIEEAIFSFLTTHATVGPLISTRCYPELKPQKKGTKVLDTVVCHNITTPGVSSHSGLSGVDEARFQFDCVSSTFLGAKTLALAVRSAFNEVTETFAGIALDSCIIEGMNNLGYFLDIKANKVAVDVTIWHY